MRVKFFVKCSNIVKKNCRIVGKRGKVYEKIANFGKRFDVYGFELREF